VLRALEGYRYRRELDDEFGVPQRFRLRLIHRFQLTLMGCSLSTGSQPDQDASRRGFHRAEARRTLARLEEREHGRLRQGSGDLPVVDGPMSVSSPSIRARRRELIGGALAQMSARIGRRTRAEVRENTNAVRNPNSVTS
jgi:hypothetical protein